MPIFTTTTLEHRRELPALSAEEFELYEKFSRKVDAIL